MIWPCSLADLSLLLSQCSPYSYRVSWIHVRHIPTSGPLHVLFLQPGTPPPEHSSLNTPSAPSLLIPWNWDLNSNVCCHYRKIFPDHQTEVVSPLTSSSPIIVFDVSYATLHSLNNLLYLFFPSAPHQSQVHERSWVYLAEGHTHVCLLDVVNIYLQAPWPQRFYFAHTTAEETKDCRGGWPILVLQLALYMPGTLPSTFH